MKFRDFVISEETVQEIIDLVSSHITDVKGLERGLDYYGSLIEKLTRAEKKKLLRWTQGHENAYIRKRLSGNIVALLRGRK